MDHKPKTVTLLLLGWLIPGAGHYCLGYKWKGIVLFSLVSLLYLTGMAMADFRNVSTGEPFYLIGYFFAGGITIVSVCVTAHLTASSGTYFYGYQLGCLYTFIASLSNFLILLKLYSLLELQEPDMPAVVTVEISSNCNDNVNDDA